MTEYLLRGRGGRSGRALLLALSRETLPSVLTGFSKLCQFYRDTYEEKDLSEKFFRYVSQSMGVFSLCLSGDSINRTPNNGIARNDGCTGPWSVYMTPRESDLALILAFPP